MTDDQLIDFALAYVAQERLIDLWNAITWTGDIPALKVPVNTTSDATAIQDAAGALLARRSA